MICYVHRGAGRSGAPSHQVERRVTEIRRVLGSQKLDRLEEAYGILEKLMAAGGHTHLIVASSPPMTARIRNCLPTHPAVSAA